MLDDLPIIREAFARTVRLVSTARLRDPVLKPLVDSDDELSAIGHDAVLLPNIPYVDPADPDRLAPLPPPPEESREVLFLGDLQFGPNITGLEWFLRECWGDVRAAVPDATLIVDANEAWHAEGLAARCQLLADLGVAMLEQPLPAGDDEALENFIHPLPICADESCHTRASLPSLRGRYEMINIKLDKTGGLTEALALAEEAQAQGFALMSGCMLCTSRAIASALPLVQNATFADLDGPTWLAVDVEPGLRFAGGQLYF